MASIAQRQAFIQKAAKSGHWLQAVLVLRQQLCPQSPWRPPMDSSVAAAARLPSAHELLMRHRQAEKAKREASSAAPPQENTMKAQAPSSSPPAVTPRSALSSLSRARLAATQKQKQNGSAGTSGDNALAVALQKSLSSASVQTSAEAAAGAASPAIYTQSAGCGGTAAAVRIGFGLDAISTAAPAASSPAAIDAAHRHPSTKELEDLLVTGCTELLPIFIRKCVANIATVGDDASSTESSSAAAFSPLSALYLLTAAKDKGLLHRLPMAVIRQCLLELVLPITAGKLKGAAGGEDYGNDSEGSSSSSSVAAREASIVPLARGLVWPLFVAFVRSSVVAVGDGRSSAPTFKAGDPSDSVNPTPAAANATNDLTFEQFAGLLKKYTVGDLTGGGSAGADASSANASYHEIVNVEMFEIYADMAAKVLSAVAGSAADSLHSLFAAAPSIITRESAALLFTIALGPEMYCKLALDSQSPIGHSASGGGGEGSEEREGSATNNWVHAFARNPSFVRSCTTKQGGILAPFLEACWGCNPQRWEGAEGSPLPATSAAAVAKAVRTRDFRRSMTDTLMAVLRDEVATRAAASTASAASDSGGVEEAADLLPLEGALGALAVVIARGGASASPSAPQALMAEIEGLVGAVAAPSAPLLHSCREATIRRVLASHGCDEPQWQYCCDFAKRGGGSLYLTLLSAAITSESSALSSATLKFLMDACTKGSANDAGTEDCDGHSMPAAAKAGEGGDDGFNLATALSGVSPTTDIVAISSGSTVSQTDRDSLISLPLPASLSSDELLLRAVFGSFAVEMALHGGCVSPSKAIAIRQQLINCYGRHDGVDNAVCAYNKSLWAELSRRLPQPKSALSTAANTLGVFDNNILPLSFLRPSQMRYLLRALRPNGVLNKPLVREYCASGASIRIDPSSSVSCSALGLLVPSDPIAWQVAEKCFAALTAAHGTPQTAASSRPSDAIHGLSVLSLMLNGGAPLARIDPTMQSCCDAVRGSGVLLLSPNEEVDGRPSTSVVARRLVEGIVDVLAAFSRLPVPVDLRQKVRLSEGLRSLVALAVDASKLAAKFAAADSEGGVRTKALPQMLDLVKTVTVLYDLKQQ